MSTHNGVSCDYCSKENFKGKRYKCLICYDYDLCSTCYEARETTNQHSTDHAMQCILTRVECELHYGGEAPPLDQTQSFTCPYCGQMGFTETTLQEHVSSEHPDSTIGVVCPICATMPRAELNQTIDDLATHLSIEHRIDQSAATGSTNQRATLEPRSLIRLIPPEIRGDILQNDLERSHSSSSAESDSGPVDPFSSEFVEILRPQHIPTSRGLGLDQSTPAAAAPNQRGSLRSRGVFRSQNSIPPEIRGLMQSELAQCPVTHDDTSTSRHANRRIPHPGRGMSRARAHLSQMQFPTSGIGLSSPSNRDSTMDPIAELLSQLSGVRRAANLQQSTTSQLQQLQMQLQIERQQLVAQVQSTRQQVQSSRQQLEHIPRRNLYKNNNTGGPLVAGGGALPTQPTSTSAVPLPPPPANSGGKSSSSSQFLLSKYMEPSLSESEQDVVDVERADRSMFVQELLLASLMEPLGLQDISNTPLLHNPADPSLAKCPL